MGNDFDVIVIGLGAMGSAAAYQLALGGKRILGIECFRTPTPLTATLFWAITLPFLMLSWPAPAQGTVLNSHQ